MYEISLAYNSSLTDTYIAYPYQKTILTNKKNIMATHDKKGVERQIL